MVMRAGVSEEVCCRILDGLESIEEFGCCAMEKYF